MRCLYLAGPGESGLSRLYALTCELKMEQGVHPPMQGTGGVDGVCELFGLGLRSKSTLVLISSEAHVYL